MSMLKRNMEETREESKVNFQRLSEMVEDVMCILKNIEKGYEGNKDFVNGDRVGRRKEINEE